MTIGENIKRIRKEKGLTQQQLAELVGIKDSGVRQYESGKYTPRTSRVREIAKALDVQVWEIDESLKDLYTSIDRWNNEHDTETLSDESKTSEILISLLGDDNASIINDFLSLNETGQAKVAEYIDDLMDKYRKE